MQPALAATASSDVSIEALTGDIGVGAWAVCGTGDLKVAPTGEVDAALTVHTNAAVHPTDASRIALRPKFRRVMYLELESSVQENRDESLAFVDVLEALPEGKRLNAADDDDVVTERRTVARTAAKLDADVGANFFLEEQRFHLFRLHEADVAGGEEAAQLRRQFDVGGAVQQEHPGVDEVRLPFILIGTQRGEQADRRLDARASLCEPQSLAVPQAELAAGETRDVEDRVEPVRLVVVGVAVARRDECRPLDADPVLVERHFEGAHLRVDVDALRRDRVVRLVPEGLVKRVAHVQAAEMAVARHAQVVTVDFVGADDADRRRPHQESVRVVVQFAVVTIGVKAERLGVTERQEILDVDVADVDLRAAAMRLVEAAVGIFFEQVERGRVELDAARLRRAEHAHARCLEHRHEAAEVGGELLHAGAHRDEVVEVADVEEFLLDERFLDADVMIETRVLAPHVGVDAVELGQVDEIQAERRREPHAPVDRTEHRVAAKQIKGRADRRDRQEDAAAAEEAFAALPLGADAARHRQVASFEQRVVDPREGEERALAEDGRIALQPVRLVRVPPVLARDVGVVPAAVAIPLG